jgi:hypothetical protein
VAWDGIKARVDVYASIAIHRHVVRRHDTIARVMPIHEGSATASAVADRSRPRESGFHGPLNRYRTSDADFEQKAPFEGRKITQPAAFVAGSLDAVLRMIPGVDMIELMRAQFKSSDASTG